MKHKLLLASGLGMLSVSTALLVWAAFWLTQGHGIYMVEQYTAGFFLGVTAVGPMLIRVSLVTLALWLIYKLATAVTGHLFKIEEEEMNYYQSQT